MSRRYTVIKKFSFDAAHRLMLDYDSACQQLHGHTWRVIVEVVSGRLNDVGMVLDFTEIGKIAKQFDHQFVNEVLNPTVDKGVLLESRDYAAFINPTAENIAEYMMDILNLRIKELVIEGKVVTDTRVKAVTVMETEGNMAIVEDDNA